MSVLNFNTSFKNYGIQSNEIICFINELLLSIKSQLLIIICNRFNKSFDIPLNPVQTRYFSEFAGRLVKGFVKLTWSYKQCKRNKKEIETSVYVSYTLQTKDPPFF